MDWRAPARCNSHRIRERRLSFMADLAMIGGQQAIV
jgi:hypothetical protein